VDFNIIVGIVGMVLMIALLFAGLPLPITFFVIGFFGIFLIRGWEATLGIVKECPYLVVANFQWSLIPMFILLSVVLFECGVGGEMFAALRAWLGHFRGGMAAATSAACAFLGTVTGSAPAATILMCKTAYPEMRKINYEPGLSLAVCAAAGTVAILIPPSTQLVIFAIVTEQSIGECLLAGFIPGFLSMAIYMAMILTRARFKPSLGPAAPAAPWRRRFIELRYLLPAVIMMLTIVGGIYTGVFTATEAGGMAAFVSFITVLAMRRLTWTRLRAILYETMRLSVMIVLLLVGIMGFFNRFLNVSWLPITMAELALGLPSPWIALAAMFIICFFLGMIIGSPLGIVILPLFVPVVEQLGFSPVWFIIIMVKLTEIGFITPPVAGNVFIAQSMIKEVPLGKAYQAAWWFVLCELFATGLFVAFPQIVMFLPDTMRATY